MNRLASWLAGSSATLGSGHPIFLGDWPRLTKHASCLRFVERHLRGTSMLFAVRHALRTSGPIRLAVRRTLDSWRPSFSRAQTLDQAVPNPPTGLPIRDSIRRGLGRDQDTGCRAIRLVGSDPCLF